MGRLSLEELFRFTSREDTELSADWSIDEKKFHKINKRLKALQYISASFSLPIYKNLESLEKYKTLREADQASLFDELQACAYSVGAAGDLVRNKLTQSQVSTRKSSHFIN